MKYLILIVLIFVTTTLQAESFTKVTKVSGLTSGGDYMRVALDDMLEAEGCKNQGYYLLDASDQLSNVMFQLLLVAKTSKQKLYVQIDGCKVLEDREYPLITHVYLCDSQYCS
ncbi:MAG: hypothetical protein AB8B92_06225 [Gammaproteobacteria bacterium]